MLYYFNPIHVDGLTLSIDNIILDTSITKSEIRDLLNTNINYIANSKKTNIVSWESYKPGTFRYQTLFRIAEDKSFWLGQGLIGNGTLIDRYRLDFNPNKIADDPNFKLICEFLVRNARGNLCRIPRFDLAIDIPVARNQCFLIKDKRMYVERRHGEEYTQYLGSKSSTVGRVKLYNKTIEANINYPLTRLELTLDPQKEYAEINFPKVYRIDPMLLAAKGMRFTDTERFILNALLQGYGNINDLGRKFQTKMKTLLEECTRPVVIPKNAYDQALSYVLGYLQ